MRQLILIEEFKECVHQDLRSHLEDKNVKTLEEGAVSSDTYTLTHKKKFLSKTQSSSVVKSSDFSKKNVQEFQSSIGSQQPLQSGSTPGARSERSEAPQGVGSLPTCNYCKKKSHVIGECWKLKKKNELQPHTCASVRNDKKALDSICSDTPDIQGSKSSSVDFMEDHYKPFLSQGFVSLSDSSEALPVQILRDTGAAQTLLLEGSLPLSEHTLTGRSVLLQGVELCVIDVPLHKIYLKSDLITGPVIVGVRSTLPVQGVSLLLGNDLAGGKVVADPIVCEKITTDVAFDDENDDLYPACAVTRAMAKEKQAENTTALNKDYPSKDIDLYDTFMSTIDDSVIRSGNQYLLTIMCTSTRFPEAIPLRNIKAKTIVKALTKFFSFVGAPKAIQSDQGSNFMSGLFQQVMHEMDIRQYKSSAYHPQSQGALERFHQTLKTMMKTYCH